jgi:hypothetical protein
MRRWRLRRRSRKNSNKPPLLREIQRAAGRSLPLKGDDGRDESRGTRVIVVRDESGTTVGRADESHSSPPGPESLARGGDSSLGGAMCLRYKRTPRRGAGLVTTWPSASSCLTAARAAIDVDDTQTPLRSLPCPSGPPGTSPMRKTEVPSLVSPSIDAWP